MTKLPHMQLWVYDIDTDRDCRRMCDAEFGRYMRLIIRQWIEGDVPSDAADAVRDARLDHDAVDSVTSLLDRKFSLRDGSGRMNRRCHEEREKATAKVERLRAIGHAGGKAKAEAHAKANGEADAETSAPRPATNGRQVSADFDAWWAAWPNKVGKKPARKAYAVARKTVDADTLLNGVAAYVRGKPQDRPWLNPQTWLNQARWEDEHGSSTAKPKTGVAALTDAELAGLWAYVVKREPDAAHMGPGWNDAKPLLKKHLAAWRAEGGKG